MMKDNAQKVTVPVMGKFKNNNLFYFIVEYRKEKCNVKMLPFQVEAKTPSKISCLYFGRDDFGHLLLEQDLTAVLEDIYEVDCFYSFCNVGNIHYDEKLRSYYLELKDDYGFDHRLYNPNEQVRSINKIECCVKSISDGSLMLVNESFQLPESDNFNMTEREIQLFQKLHDDKVQDAKTFNKPAYRQYWNSIVDKYPDSAHFIYELLQNADDAGATNVEIYLAEEYLIFKHNGIERFTVSDVADDGNDDKPKGHINAITGIGFTTKGGELSVQNKIGKFGVGFKAVFQYTNRPEIYDDIFRFSLENYIIPTLIPEDHPLRKRGETLFLFPFKNPHKAFGEIHSKLKNMENPILFLNNLLKISWQLIADDVKHVYSKYVSNSFVKQDVMCELIQLHNEEQIRSIWMFSQNVKINNGNHRISVGYYLNKQGYIDTQVRPPIHCFFPTKESLGLCIISHAPFLLTDSRQNIKDNEDVNKVLMQQLAILAAAALPILCNIGINSDHLLINENILDIVPTCRIRSYIWDSAPTVDRNLFFESYRQIMLTQKVIVDRNGQYLSVKNCRIANPINIQELLSDEQLQMLTQNRSLGFVFSDISAKQKEKREYLESDLDVKVITSADIATLIKENKEFMNKQSDDWLHKFYYFLYTDAIKLWKLETASKNQVLPFRETPIIKTTCGTFVAPYDKDAPNVFYSTPNYIDIEREFFYVDSSLLNHANTRKFFDELGIREYDLKDTITQILVRNEKGGEIDDNILRKDLCFIYDYCSQTVSHEERPNLISEISRRLNVVYTLEGESYYGPISSVYDDSKHIDYFKENSEIKVIDCDFYQEVFDRYSKSKILSFLRELGLKSTPTIEESYTSIDRNQIYSYPNKRIKRILQDNYSTRDYEIREMIMPGLNYVIRKKLSKKDSLECDSLKKLSIKIWQWLSNEIEQEKNWHQMLINGFYYSEFSKTIDSRMFWLLKTSKWIFVDSLPKGTPDSFSRRQMLDAGYVKDEKLFDILGVRSTWEDSPDIPDDVKKCARIGKKFIDRIGDDPKKLKEFEEMLDRMEQRRTHQQNQTSECDDNSPEKRLRQPNVDEFFHEKENKKNRNEKQGMPPNLCFDCNISIEERMEKFKESQNDALELERRMVDLRNLAEKSPRYTKEWFEALLELEYKNYRENDASITSKAISISFQRVEKEKGSDRIYVLKNPAKPIPLGIEDVGGIAVKFLFSHKEEVEFSFEVASVRDFTLRLKAKIVDVDLLDRIDWTKCTYAEININNPVKLVGKLRGAFAQLNLPDRYNLKDNIRNDIEFVFGPPGTGKTTYLSKCINELVENSHRCKILVLAPTNKACDVLTTKLMGLGSCDSWLRRFVACGDQSIANQGFLCDRDSDAYKYDRCCIVSTIARLPYDGFGNPQIGLRDIMWDYVFIDEASMIPVAQIVYALYKFNDSKIIIAGDPFQISPIVREQAWVDENIYTMVNLNSFTNPKTEPHEFTITNLDTQYRSLSAVGRLFSEYAYNGMLKHYRQGEKPCGLVLNGMEISAINFIPFRVEKYDSIYGPRKLGGSNVQIYSVLFTVEFVKYISQQWNEQHPIEEVLRIGVICPYAAQAQLIDTMLQQRRELYPNIEIISGTIHGFQGDECDVVIAVLNPPKGLKGMPERIFLNRKNILNVAISRARDYLFVLIPHVDTDGYANLEQIHRIGAIAKTKCAADMSIINADMVEKIMFDDSAFIERNTFVTSHQMANVYTDAQKLYEVRIDENAVDIQINSELQ